MELINQSHEILGYPATGTLDVEVAGRTCYKSEDLITPKSADKFAKMLLDRKHHAMVEFGGDIIVRFVTNRGITHELVRHRLCSFAQESTRYVNYRNKDMQFIKPVWSKVKCGHYSIPVVHATEMDVTDKIFLESCLQSEKNYNDLSREGWAPQKAREVLPNALKTEIVMKANVREWRHIFMLRTAKAAHPQMRALMRPFLKKVQQIVPIIFDDIGEE